MFLFKFAKRLVTILVLLVVVVPLYVASQIWTTASSSHAISSDAVVVLGAAQFNGKPTPVLQLRIDKALEVYKSGLVKKSSLLAVVRLGIELLKLPAAQIHYVLVVSI